MTSENSIQTSLSHDISLQKRAKLALLLLVLYFMLILIEQNLKPGVTHDALQQLHFIDKWQWKWGYISTQPPLYHWLFKIFVDICSFLNLDFRFADSLFRQCLMMFNILISYLIFRQYKIDQYNSIFSAFGLFLISDVSWSLQYNYTHTALAVTTTLLFILQFVLLLNRPTLQNYFSVGCAIAWAILSKYNTIFTVISVVFASLSMSYGRNVIVRFRFLITLLTASIIFLPHFNWILLSMNSLDKIRQILKTEDINEGILPMLINSSSVVALFIVQILPLLISLVIIFKLRYNWLKIMIAKKGNQALLGRSFLITILIYLLFMITFDARIIHIHWLLPAVLLLPLALPLAAFEIGKINQYGKGIFVSAVLVKTICFAVMTLMDILGDAWPFP